MKRYLVLLLFLSVGFIAKSQKIAFVGVRHLTTGNNGVSILALDDLSASEVYYFTDNEYDNVSNQFVDMDESVVKITITSSITKGNVIYFEETDPDIFEVSVTPSSGTATVQHVAASGKFAIGSFGESLFLYSDNDEVPTNGVTEIHASFFAGNLSISDFSGGTMPASENPISDFPNALVLHNFPVHNFNNAPYDDGLNRIEYNTSIADRTDVNKVKLLNSANFVMFASEQDLSTTFFTNFNLETSKPIVTLTSNVGQLQENSSSNFTLTFELDKPAPADLEVNFSVSGVATYNTDYTQTGAGSMSGSSGKVVISSGSSSKILTIDPTGDPILEPDEDIEISIVAGANYEFGSPSIVAAILKNDDSKSVEPAVAITGIRCYSTDENVDSEFSFVAIKNISSGTSFVFSNGFFDKDALVFEDISSLSSALKWTAPAAGIAKGEVVVVKKTAANTFSLSCNGGSCGTVAKLSPAKSFYISEHFGLFIAHTDNDDNPYNGITTIQSVIYAYDNSAIFGGDIPLAKDLSKIYHGSILVDGFSNVSPSRLEFLPSLRSSFTVNQSSFENPANWLYAQPQRDLSVVPFVDNIPNVFNPDVSPDLNGTVFVKEGGIGTGNSWTDPSGDLQLSIYAINTVSVWVAGGTYKPIYPYNSDFSTNVTADPSNRNNAFVLRNDIKIYGGFEGSETSLVDRDLSVLANSSILSGDIDDDGVLNTTNAYHVVRSDDNNNTAQLDGFTVTMGNSNENIVGGNGGGGIYLKDSSPSFSNLTVTGNYGKYGGGISSAGSSPIIMNSVIKGNSGENGGGIYGSNGMAKLTNVLISGNSGNNGGGVFNYNSDAVFTNVTISGNTQDGTGGGMYNTSNSSPVIRNCIIYGNKSGIYNNSNGSGLPVISYSIVQGSGGSNAARVAAWDVSIGTDGGNNLDVNPQFANAPSYTTAPFTNGDYSLTSSSPAINKGDNSQNSTSTDLNGNSRIQGSVIDLGAIETDTPLPVNLLTFTAKAQNEGVLVQWATVGESMNKGFTVKRSSNGFNFETISQIDGNHTTTDSKRYSYFDQYPHAGINYYQLWQTDVDGTIENLGMRAVNFETDDVEVAVFPNPSTGIFQVEYHNGKYNKLELFDVNGILLQEKPINIVQIKTELTVQNLPSGQYFIKLSGGQTVQIKRIMKQ